MYFTSIASLRVSGADKTRVDSVERALKKLNPQWNTNWWFPIVQVGMSNAAADVSWVKGAPSTHLSTSAKVMLVGDFRITSAGLLKLARESMSPPSALDSRNKTAWVTAELEKFDAALQALTGQATSTWTQGLAYLSDAPEQKKIQEQTSTPTTAVIGGVASAATNDVLTVDAVQQVKDFFDVLTTQQKHEVARYAMDATAENSEPQGDTAETQAKNFHGHA
jgi:hypothetical protein